ncbi:hypothetical protein, partial [Klebsiella pneumoniae]|uniref:hypothetical protein n=1 Tax=Klebsiella pneumoniae TaxID=573 RepID=UPI00195429EB
RDAAHAACRARGDLFAGAAGEPRVGVVLQVPVEVVDAEAGIIRFEDEGETIEQSIFGGKAKLQWKPDWGMRWAALGVDYEMYGKD